MRSPEKLALFGFLALMLGSCSRIFPLDMIFRDGRLVFTTEREWKWFIIPHRPKAELCSIDVFDAERYVWRVKGKGEQCLKDGIPIAYGEQRPQLETIVPATPLIAGRRYGVEVLSWDHGSANFRVTHGQNPIVRLYQRADRNWVHDPEHEAFLNRRTRRLAELRAKGLSEDDALDRWAEEAFPTTQENHSAPAAPANAATPATTR